MLLPSIALLVTSFVSTSFATAKETQPPAARMVPWEYLPNVKMKGDLHAFWNVIGGDKAYNDPQAFAHGFETVDLLNTFADYAGKQKENIQTAMGKNRTNPWNRPSFFEKIIRQNLGLVGKGSILVHDIELPLEDDYLKAWQDGAARRDSGAKSEAEFKDKYYAEWATWYTLPAKWSKEIRPRQPVGFYGPQVFGREYWGAARRESWSKVEEKQKFVAEFWKHIDPVVDFYTASTYFFYDTPDSLYYVATNVEENYLRSRQYGSKPVYAYAWLRFHTGGPAMDTKEIDPFLAEAAAVIPYFSGAKGVVLWGYEPGRKGQYYETLPIFVKSLARVSALSEKISQGKIDLSVPAREFWWRKAPLVRRIDVAEDECIFMGANPWQAESGKSQVETMCGSRKVILKFRGKHTDLFHVQKGKTTVLKAE